MNKQSPSPKALSKEWNPPGLMVWVGVSIFLHFCLTCALVRPIATKPPELRWARGERSIEAYFVASSIALKKPLEAVLPDAPHTQILAAKESDCIVEAPAPTPEAPFQITGENSATGITTEHTLESAQNLDEASAAVSSVTAGSSGAQGFSASGQIRDAAGFSSTGCEGAPGGYPPSPLTCPLPRYPKWAREQGIEGTVHLSILVGKDGRPQDVSLARSCGYPELDNTALETAKKRWRFSPATQGGKPIEQRIAVAVKFELK